MTIHKKTLLFSATFLLVACGGMEPEYHEQSDSLIGGRQARNGEFDATMYIWTNGTACTAARIGPREILTAAHCVMDVGNGNFIADGTDLVWFKNSKVLAGSNWRNRGIRSIRVHPSWEDACGNGCANNVTLSSPYPADVALITTDTTLPADILQAKVYWGPMLSNGLVTVTGYGCENNINTPNGSSRLKVEETKVVPMSNVTFNDAYVVTPGMKKISSEASLCFGDSGGPLYLGHHNDLIVGVNAYYSFNDNSGVSYHNTHTRLGFRSQHDVIEWLIQFVQDESFVGPG